MDFSPVAVESDMVGSEKFPELAGEGYGACCWFELACCVTSPARFFGPVEKREANRLPGRPTEERRVDFFSSKVSREPLLESFDVKGFESEGREGIFAAAASSTPL